MTNENLSALSPGMHISVGRYLSFYRHHGIYSGEGTVIHYNDSEKVKGKGEIQETPLSDFLNGGTLRIEKHEYTEEVLADSLKRAKAKIGELKYSLVSGNCEHFANWCVTGEEKSWQVREALGVVAAVVAGVVVVGIGSLFAGGSRKG